jgi:hypothetical protein
VSGNPSGPAEPRLAERAVTRREEWQGVASLVRVSAAIAASNAPASARSR